MDDVRNLDYDFKVHDGYVAFSAEIVRLALLAPGAFAFFVAQLGTQSTAPAYSKLIAPAYGSMIGSLIFLTLAVALGLAHRYLANDFMATLVEKRRSADTMKGDWRPMASTASIIGAPVCLAVGAALLFAAIVKIIN